MTSGDREDEAQVKPDLGDFALSAILSYLHFAIVVGSVAIDRLLSHKLLVRQLWKVIESFAPANAQCPSLCALNSPAALFARSRSCPLIRHTLCKSMNL